MGKFSNFNSFTMVLVIWIWLCKVFIFNPYLTLYLRQSIGIFLHFLILQKLIFLDYIINKKIN
jgi:hypothetical protein